MKTILLMILLTTNISMATGAIKLKTLKTGNIIYRTTPIKNAPWPQAQLLTLIDNLTPEEAAAIFSSYRNQKNFVPDLLKSEVVKQITPDDVHVSFTMDGPWPLADEHYTTGNVLSKRGNDYKIDWYLVKSETIFDTRGQIRFSKHSSGKTLMSYKTFVHPKSKLAFLAKGFLRSKITNSIKEIAKYFNSFKAKHPKELQVYVAQMNQVLRHNDSD